MRDVLRSIASDLLFVGIIFFLAILVHLVVNR